MELPNPGSYTAQQRGPVIIRAEESGSLMAYVPYLIPAINFTGDHALCLCAKDGTASAKNIQNLKTVFPNWDQDSLADIPMPAEGEEIPQFELADCFHDDSYTPQGAEAPVIQFKAKWFNPVGGGRKTPMTDAERKAAVAKYASKFKALLSTPKPAAKPAAKPEAKKPVVSGPPSRGKGGSPAVASQARTSSQQEVWDALVAANPKEAEDKLGDMFYAAQDKVRPDANGELTPAEWGQCLTELGL